MAEVTLASGRDRKSIDFQLKSSRKVSISSVEAIEGYRERPGSKKDRFSIKIIEKSIDFERRDDREVIPRAAGIEKASIFN